MPDIDKSFIEPLTANFEKIDTDKDGYMSSDELSSASVSNRFSKEVQETIGIAGKHLSGISCENLDKGSVKAGRAEIAPTKDEYSGISQKDLSRLSTRAQRMKDEEALANYGLSKFEIIDRNNDQIIDLKEAEGSRLYREFYNIAHVVRTSNELRTNPYGKPEHYKSHHYGINRPDLEAYPSKVLNQPKNHNLRDILKDLD
ncbi:MAG: hypothetical protein K2X27_23425 [Candidatus Obscuribacterales bacterium]|nr:hypothetical protein [Candidatus Obscuribacterales bacterium]